MAAKPFIDGRLILDITRAGSRNFTHNEKSRSRGGWVGIKIDFKKVFDKLEWNFIFIILKNLGCHETFIN